MSKEIDKNKTNHSSRQIKKEIINSNLKKFFNLLFFIILVAFNVSIIAKHKLIIENTNSVKKILLGIILFIFIKISMKIKEIKQIQESNTHNSRKKIQETALEVILLVIFLFLLILDMVFILLTL